MILSHFWIFSDTCSAAAASGSAVVRPSGKLEWNKTLFCLLFLYIFLNEEGGGPSESEALMGSIDCFCLGICFGVVDLAWL